MKPVEKVALGFVLLRQQMQATGLNICLYGTPSGTTRLLIPKRVAQLKLPVWITAPGIIYGGENRQGETQNVKSD